MLKPHKMIQKIYFTLLPYQLYTKHIKIKNSIKSLRFFPQTQVRKINSTLLFQNTNHRMKITQQTIIFTENTILHHFIINVHSYNQNHRNQQVKTHTKERIRKI